jgi:hypothetical protein
MPNGMRAVSGNVGQRGTMVSEHSKGILSFRSSLKDLTQKAGHARCEYFTKGLRGVNGEYNKEAPKKNEKT